MTMRRSDWVTPLMTGPQLNYPHTHVHTLYVTSESLQMAIGRPSIYRHSGSHVQVTLTQASHLILLHNSNTHTHTRTHARTHARTHTPTHIIYNVRLPIYAYTHIVIVTKSHSGPCTLTPSLTVNPYNSA